MHHFFQNHKKVIFKSITVFIFLALISFCIEYFVFGHTLHALSTKQSGTRSIFHETTATQEKIDIPLQGDYINNLRVDFPANPDSTNIILQYTNPQTKEIVTLKPQATKNLEKLSLNFLNYTLFHIDSNPTAISIIPQDTPVEITNISIDNTYHFNHYRFFFVFATGLIVLFFIFFRQTIGNKPEYAFFVIAFICGGLMTFSDTLSYTSWDELSHYKKSDDFSFKSLLPKHVVDIYSITNSVPHSYSLEEQSDLNQYFDTNPKKASQQSAKNTSFSLLGFYTNVSHLPSGLMIFLGRLFHLPAHIIFTLGRFINVVIFSCVIFFAIRFLKSGKMILATIALLPTSLFLASHYSYDSWVTAWIALGLAMLFSEIQQPNTLLSSRKYIAILGALLLGLASKAIYFPLLALLFLIPSNKFATPKEYRKYSIASVCTILFVVSSFLIPFLFSGKGGDDTRGGKDVNSSAQIHFIFSEPLTYTKTLTSFITNYINPLHYEGLATSFAYLNTIAGFYPLIIILILVTLFDKNKSDAYTGTFITRSLIIAIFLGTVALISTALYIAFTPVGLSTINGVQSRYLTPLLFPLFFIIGSHKIRHPFNTTIVNASIFAILAIIALHGIWTNMVQFYY